MSRFYFKLILSLFAILLISISAQMAIQLPPSISSIPITAQSLAVIVMAHLFKSKWALFISSAYVILGCFGLPIFSKFSGGIDVFLGPSGGYLIGFIVCSFLIGSMAKKQPAKFVYISLQLIIGTLLILLCGYLWLLHYYSPLEAFKNGVSPFILGGIIKIIIGSVILSLYYKFKSISNNIFNNLK